MSRTRINDIGALSSLASVAASGLSVEQYKRWRRCHLQRVWIWHGFHGFACDHAHVLTCYFVLRRDVLSTVCDLLYYLSLVRAVIPDLTVRFLLEQCEYRPDSRDCTLLHMAFTCLLESELALWFFFVCIVIHILWYDITIMHEYSAEIVIVEHQKRHSEKGVINSSSHS